MFILFVDHHLRLVLSLRSEHIVFVCGEGKHDAVELIGSIVIDVEEIIEAASESWIYSEEVVHLHPVSCHDAYELAPIVLHTFHKRL